MPASSDAVVEKVNLAEELKTSMGSYGVYVNFSRAIPDVADGLKPVHRRILWAMNNARMRHSDKVSKSAKAVGEVMGNYHPHGDSAIYDSMVTLCQPWRTLIPLVDGQGNWGSKTDGPAASRYTECRLTAASAMLLGWHPGQTTVKTEIDEHAVNMVRNYDGQLDEPAVLPALFPNFLVNGTQGIGFGRGTKGASHNLREIMSLAAYMVDTPNPTIGTVRKHVPGPEEPDNCEVFDTDNESRGISSYMLTGEGSYIVRARMDIEEYEAGTKRNPQKAHRIIISGLPPRTSVEQTKSIINWMIETNNLPLGCSFQDHSHGESVHMVLDVGVNDPEDVKARILLDRDTGLQYSEAVYMNAFDSSRNEIRMIGLIEAMNLWLDHRRSAITRRSTDRRTRAHNRLHIVDGFIKAVPLAEQIVVVVRSSDNRSHASETMQQKWGFSAAQADAILDMTIGQITKLGADRYVTEKASLEEEVAEMTRIIDDPSYLNKVLKGEIRAVAKELGRDRKSHVVEGSAYVERPTTPAYEEPAVNGYLVRTGKNSLRFMQSSRFNRLMGDDYVVEVDAVTSKNMVEMITSWGYSSRLPMDAITKNPTPAQRVFFDFLDSGERPVFVGSVANRGGLDADLYCITQQGLGKRLTWEVWADRNNRRAFQMLAPAEGDVVQSAFFATPDKDVMIISGFGKAIKIDTDNLTPKGRTARPLEFMDLARDGEGNLHDGEGVVFAEGVSAGDRILYWTSENKVGIFPVDDVRRQGRGRSGSWIIDGNADFYVVGARVLKEEDTTFGWYHGSFSEPRTLNIEDIPVGTGLGTGDLVQAKGVDAATSIWTE